MTIFEQTISNTEVQMAIPIAIGLILHILFVWPITFLLIFKFTPHGDYKDIDEEEKNYTLSDIILGTIGLIGLFAFFTPIAFITVYAVLSTVHFIPPLQKAAIGYEREDNFMNSIVTKNINKPIFSEKYSEEIANATHNKLGDFNIDMCGAPKDKEHTTILCGGNNTNPITATKDDKYYTLTPIIKTHHDSIFHGGTATVTLTVDIKEK